MGSMVHKHPTHQVRPRWAGRHKGRAWRLWPWGRVQPAWRLCCVSLCSSASFLSDEADSTEYTSALTHLPSCWLLCGPLSTWPFLPAGLGPQCPPCSWQASPSPAVFHQLWASSAVLLQAHGPAPALMPCTLPALSPTEGNLHCSHFTCRRLHSSGRFKIFEGYNCGF